MTLKNQLTRTPYLVLFMILISVGVGTASALITITLAGNVVVDGTLGVGTATPQQELHVAGDIRLDRGISFSEWGDKNHFFEFNNDLILESKEDIILVSPAGTVVVNENLEMTNGVISNLATPTNPNDAATKGYVDSIAIPIPSNKTVSISAGANSPGCENNNDCYFAFTILAQNGDTIIWTNDDTAAHTVTSGSPSLGLSGVFDSGLIPGGNTFENIFGISGSYPYFCQLHPWMKGEVLVI